MFRKIVGTISKSSTFKVNAFGLIYLLDNTYTNEISYLKSVKKYQTDNQGRIYDPENPTDLGLPLWCNAEGLTTSRYRFVYPDSTSFDFSLVPGVNPVNISELRQQGVIDTPEPALLDVVNQALAQQWQQTLLLINTDYIVATTPLSALRIVNLTTGTYADASVVNSAYNAKGFTQTAVSSGQTFILKTSGIVFSTSWQWDITKPILLGLNGILTQNPTGVSYIQQIATAIAPTQISLEFKESIIL